jgi:hypothetical protein
VILVALGLYSGWLFSLGHYWTGVFGGVISLAASILDGCDGEIARLSARVLDRDVRRLLVLRRHLHRLDSRRRAADRMASVLLARRDRPDRNPAVFWAAHLVEKSDHRRETGEAARNRAGALQGTPDLVVARRVANLVRGDRAAMPYGILALALVYALPGVVVLAAVGANVYWISLVLKLQHLLNEQQEAVAA